jgi:biotin operon repressor
MNTDRVAKRATAGRPRTHSDELRARVRDLSATKSQQAIARELGVSQNFVWKTLREVERELEPAD